MFLCDLPKLAITIADGDRFLLKFGISFAVGRCIVCYKILLKSDTVCRSYENVYSGLLFPDTVYFYAHVLRLGVKKAPTSLSRTTNLFVSNCTLFSTMASSKTVIARTNDNRK